jgi:hypothetical protein
LAKHSHYLSRNLPDSVTSPDLNLSQDLGDQEDGSYPERLRRASESQSKRSSIRRFTKRIFKLTCAIRSSNALKLFLFIILSLLINSLYFNYFYFQSNEKIQYAKTSFGKLQIFLNQSKFFLKPFKSSLYFKDPNKKFFKQNLEHVSFFSFNDDPKTDESTEYSLINNVDDILALEEQTKLELEEKGINLQNWKRKRLKLRTVVSS